jgi:hypothetical protein
MKLLAACANAALELRQVEVQRKGVVELVRDGVKLMLQTPHLR